VFGALPDLSAKAAELRPRKTALEEIATGRSATYAELDARASRAAGLLAAQGVGGGDRVALLCRNRIEFFELMFAAGKLGAILVPLNWRMPAEELKGLVADSEPGLLLYGAEDAAAARALAAGGLPAVGLDEDYAARRDGAEAHPGREWWPAEETWYLLYTSGTTGAPKGVIQTYAMAWVNYVNIGQAIGLTEADTTLCFLPLFHAGGIGLHALPTLIAGGTVKVLPGFDADAVVELIAAGAIDTFFGVPAVYRELCAHPRFEGLDLTRVRHWGSGGAALPTIFVERFAAGGVALCAGMGMTETGPTAFLMDPARAAEKPGSVGKPQALVRARVIGADGREAAAGEVGPLQFAGPGVTPGYWNKPEATAAAFTADGWLRTGDLAMKDVDGDFWIAGRTKEMFISGGENVYPAEVENVLCDHPAVAEVVVVGVADEAWGEVGRAFVVLKPGAAADEAELRAFCRSRLAGYKVPKAIAVVDDLPRNALGKVQKHLLLQPDPAL
jgi:fatty-acyl-CoA synthase